VVRVAVVWEAMVHLAMKSFVVVGMKWKYENGGVSSDDAVGNY
jgi:hypothetical protein